MGVLLWGKSPHRVNVLGSGSKITVNTIYIHFFPENVFVTIKKNVPDNRNKITYTFGSAKYRPNKRSQKLGIKAHMVRVTIFLSKSIADWR